MASQSLTTSLQKIQENGELKIATTKEKYKKKTLTRACKPSANLTQPILEGE